MIDATNLPVAPPSAAVTQRIRPRERAATTAKLSLLAALLLTAPLLTALGATLPAQSDWTKGAYLAANGDCPPFVFLTLREMSHEFGCDAFADEQLAGRLNLGQAGRELWFMDKSRSAPAKLFPLPSHQALVGSGVGLARGSVHEPSVYHHPETNQYWVFFSFAADLVDPRLHKPCNLYAMNITSALLNPTGFQPGQLPVVKLDDAGNYSEQAVYNRSVNPQLMPQGSWQNLVAWPSSNGVDVQFETSTGACVVDTEAGPMLYYASNMRRSDGERMFAGALSFTQNTVKLLNKNEIMHFGTTSLISFFETPHGVGGSYRSSTEATGQWGIFEFGSDGAEWRTLSGYANQQNVADHNGTTLAMGNDPKDHLLAISRYYIGNNEGFGTIVLLPYGKTGRNDDNGLDGIHQRGWFAQWQNTTNLFPAIPEFFDLSAPAGKFALPAAGRKATDPADIELFLTYSSGTAHGIDPQNYDAKLVVVTDIRQKIWPSNGTYLPGAANPNYPVKLVLSSETRHAFAMKPIMTHKERFGWKHREVLAMPGELDPTTVPAALKDMPVAQVIAGPIHDTDLKSMPRRLGGFYDPTTEARNNSFTDHLAARISCLTKDVPHGYFDNPANHDEVWGVRVFITDSAVRKLIKADDDQIYGPNSRWGYLHHNGGGTGPFGTPLAFERYRHLSDVPADADGKVNFYLPANVPVKFQLLHRDGTVLSAQRGHHSFAPGQLEKRCTGCHEHVDPIPGEAFSNSAPHDLLNKTGLYSWDAAGQPTFQWHNQPSRDVPEFRADIWPLLMSECASCHNSSTNPNGTGLDSDFDLSMTMPNSNDSQLAVWAWLNQRRYVNRRMGAAKSPLTWHFKGLANDNELRLDKETNQRYKNTISNGIYGPPQDSRPSRYWITVQPGANNPHPGVADQRKTYKIIEWIEAGAAIEHGAINPAGNPDARLGVNGDGYQIALSARLESYGSTNVKIGYWDAKANVQRVEVTVRNSKRTFYVSGQGNGVVTHSLFWHNLTQPAIGPEDVLKIAAFDAAGNVARVEKTLLQLIYESETHRGRLRVTTNGKVFDGGDQLTFTVDGTPSLGNLPFFHVLSDDIYPPTIAPAIFGIYSLPKPGPWFDLSLSAGIVGSLGGQGNGSWTMQLPPSIVAAELYCQIVAIDGTTLAKSNIVSFQTR